MTEQLPGLPGFTVERYPSGGFRVLDVKGASIARFWNLRDGMSITFDFPANSPAQALAMVAAALRVREQGETTND